MGDRGFNWVLWILRVDFKFALLKDRTPKSMAGQAQGPKVGLCFGFMRKQTIIANIWGSNGQKKEGKRERGKGGILLTNAGLTPLGLFCRQGLSQ